MHITKYFSFAGVVIQSLQLLFNPSLMKIWPKGQQMHCTLSNTEYLQNGGIVIINSVSDIKFSGLFHLQ